MNASSRLPTHCVVLVKYDTPPPDGNWWMERYICAHVEKSEYMICTPDFDFYVEDLSLGNDDLAGLRHYRAGGELPPGVESATVYGFKPLTRSDRTAIAEEGAALAVGERATRRLPAVSGGVAKAPGEGSRRPRDVAPTAYGVPTGASSSAGNRASARGSKLVQGDGMWVLDEPCATGDIGDILQLPGGTTTVEDRALIDHNGEVVCLRWLPPGTDIAAYVQERKALLAEDRRVAPAGKEFTEVRFSEAAKELIEDTTLDFSSILEGPRTLPWIVDKVAVSADSGFVSRHQRWVRDSNIPSSSRFIHEHVVLSKILDHAIKWDRLNVKNLASAEYAARRMQLIEDVHSEDPQNPNWEGAEHYMGDIERKGGVLVAPTLKKHVASEISQTTAIMKEKRKAREARKDLVKA